MRLPTRSASQSSASTLTPKGQRPFLDDDDDDDDTPSTPKLTSYDDRLNDLLADDPETYEDAEEGEAEEEVEGEEDGFVYRGQDGADLELLDARRRAEWGDEDEEESFLDQYESEMKDILGEEEVGREPQAADEVTEADGAGFVHPADDVDDEALSDKTTSSPRPPEASPGSPDATLQPLSQLTPSRRPAFLHPSISRLRSHIRHPSTSSINSTSSSQAGRSSQNPPPAPPSSHFSQLSRTTSSSTLHSLNSSSHLSTKQSQPASTPSSADPIHYTTLKRISHFLYPSRSSAKLASLGAMAGAEGRKLKRGELGVPTVMSAEGMICVGTDKGWVGVWDFKGEMRGWYGNESISSTAGSVTALTLSPDHTFIAVGHASGHIHLFDLSTFTPQTPTRTAPPTTLAAVNSGRREGHLIGTRILHLGFVGKRHTAIVSGDESGMSFYHSLGRVLGVDSTDVLRVLGSYPESSMGNQLPPTPTAPTDAFSSSSTKQRTTLFAANPLPYSSSSALTKSSTFSGISSTAHPPHPSDDFNLSALLTPSKLIIIGLKPSPRTWFRKLRANEGGEEGGRTGCAAWKVSGGSYDRRDDPVLAWSWGNAVRFLRVAVKDGEVAGGEKGKGTERKLEFVEEGKWECTSGAVVGLDWLDQDHVFVLTGSSLFVLDVRNFNLVDRSDIDSRILVPNGVYASPGRSHAPRIPLVAKSMSVHKGKVFFLTKADVRVGSVLTWTDHILSLMQLGDILSAIRLCTSYYSHSPFSPSSSSTILSLPSSPSERQTLVGDRLRDLMRSSLRYAFSEDRMTDGTHASFDGRGVDRTELFEGLIEAMAEACLALADLDFLWEDVYEKYQENYIEGIFFSRLRPFILDGRIQLVPTNIVQSLLRQLDDRDELDKLETLIWHLDPTSLDINQAIGLCQKHRLWDALVFVYIRALRDYVSPVVELLGLVRRIQQHRIQRPSRVGGESIEDGITTTDEEVEALVPDAYKLFAYLEDVFSGLAYPSKEPLPDEEAAVARASVYAFVFSHELLSSPSSNQLVPSLDPSTSPYPYLRLLLHFDPEAFLHAMDIAFEDPYLNDEVSPISRQVILHLMLEVMSPSSPSPFPSASSPRRPSPTDFPTSDLTLLHIFISRNLPKYPQFLVLPPSNLHQILISLSTDPDQSTREDRQLAVEYLLSAYTPHDPDQMLALFEEAGFFRILRTTYRAEKRWASLASTYLNDPDSNLDVFASLTETLRAASTPSSENASSTHSPAIPSDLTSALLEAIPQLADLDVRRTSFLIDQNLPKAHSNVLARLASTPRKQYGYLRCLLEPQSFPFEDGQELFIDEGSKPSGLFDVNPSSSNLSPGDRQLYISLLADFDRSEVIPLLEARPTSFFDLDKVVEVCEEKRVGDAVVWALDRQGKTKEAFGKVSSVINERGGSMGESLAGALLEMDGEGETVRADLDELSKVVRMGVKLCLRYSTSANPSSVDVAPEDMWFGIIHELIDLVHSVSSILPDPSAQPSSFSSSFSLPSSLTLFQQHQFSQQPVPILLTLRSLVQETLASLVSTSSSTTISFPQLFRRLVSTSSLSPSAVSPSTSPAPSRRRVYSEFRTILAGMLDTYKSDGELMVITLRLLERDRFQDVEALARGKERGWCGGGKGGDLCGGCGERLTLNNKGRAGIREKRGKGKRKLLSETGRGVDGDEEGLDGEEEENEQEEESSGRVVIFRSGVACHQRCLVDMSNHVEA